MDEATIWKSLTGFPPGLVRKFILRYEESKKLTVPENTATVTVEPGTVNKILAHGNDSKKYYEKLDKSKPLKVDESKTVRNFILSYFLSQKKRLSIRNIDELAEDIVRCFPKEKKEVYFNGDKKTGYLYTEYNNKVRALRDTNPSCREPIQKKRKVMHTPQESDQESEIVVDSATLYSDELVKGVTSTTDLSEIISHWKLSSVYRFNIIKKLDNKDKISKIFEEYALYNRTDGLMFVSI